MSGRPAVRPSGRP
ncbi:unnamed protein product, partial [Rotaria sp. Silwood2]